jgi:hypothetical protein
MRRADVVKLALCLLSIGLVVSSAALGQRALRSDHKILVPRSVVSQELAYRPHSIGIAADGTFDFFKIRWLTYGSSVARARARAYLRGCTPDCARGEVTRPKASLRFTHLIPCRGARVYSRVHFVLHGRVPAGRAHRGSTPLIIGSAC